MHNLAMRGLRAAGLIAMAIAVAQCGDSSVKIVGGGNVDPTPGEFRGVTNNGGQVILLVGSVESATLICQGQTFGGPCNPPLPVENSNAIGTCSGLSLDVTFVSNDRAEINDISAGTSCDGSGSADLLVNGVPPTTTPTTTPGGNGPATVTPTPTGAGTPTPTATGGTTVPPTATPGPEGTPCPTRLTLEGQGSQAILNTGTTGLAFNQTVINNGTMTVALENCNPGTPGNCGVCDVVGPAESRSQVDNHRCQGDTSMTCTSDDDCGGSGPCKFIFGAYLPLTSGGIPVCVRNVVEGQITGTADIEGGSGASVVNLTSQVFSGILIDQPCPICTGGGFLSQGTCQDGPRNGLPCTVHGTTDKFGNTSFDCPTNEGAVLASLDINLSPTTGTSAINPGPTCVTFPFSGLTCYCTSQKMPNSCTNGLCDIMDADGVGVCTGGPNNGICEPTDTFRTCLNDGDCPTGGDSCVFDPDPCHGPQDPDTFAINAPLTRTGTESTTNPTLSAGFCIASVSGAVDQAAGLPGPGTLLLPTKTCFTDDTGECVF